MPWRSANSSPAWPPSRHQASSNQPFRSPAAGALTAPRRARSSSGNAHPPVKSHLDSASSPRRHRRAPTVGPHRLSVGPPRVHQRITARPSHRPSPNCGTTTAHRPRFRPAVGTDHSRLRRSDFQLTQLVGAEWNERSVPPRDSPFTESRFPLSAPRPVHDPTTESQCMNHKSAASAHSGRSWCICCNTRT